MWVDTFSTSLEPKLGAGKRPAAKSVTPTKNRVQRSADACWVREESFTHAYTRLLFETLSTQDSRGHNTRECYGWLPANILTYRASRRGRVIRRRGTARGETSISAGPWVGSFPSQGPDRSGHRWCCLHDEDHCPSTPKAIPVGPRVPTAPWGSFQHRTDQFHCFVA